jgi:hypothetical protein
MGGATSACASPSAVYLFSAMSPGELATLWTVRLALLAYFAGGALRASPPDAAWWRAGRLAWSGGCVLYLAHVACAFHFFYAWSHSAAYHRTAAQTLATTGWNWGGGLYLNYLFTAVWLADSLWWWRQPARRRIRWLEIVVQLFMWFMVFNATVVFGHGAVRWFGLVGCGLLAALGCNRNSRALTFRYE